MDGLTWRVVRGAFVRPLAAAALVMLTLTAGAAVHASPSSAILPPGTEPLQRGDELLLEEWLSVSFLGAKIGYVHTAIREVQGGGYLNETEAVMKLKMARKVQITSLSEETSFDEHMGLRGFTFRQSMGGRGLVVSGRPVAGGLELKTRPSGGAEKTMVIHGEEPVFPISSLGLVVFIRGLEEGKQYRFSALLEPLLTVVPVEISVGPREKVDLNGQSVEGFKVTTTYGGFSSSSWVEDGGMTIKETSAEGFESTRVSEAEALAFDHEDLVSADRFLMATKVRSDRILEKPGRLTGMKVILEGFPLGFLPPEGSFQKLAGQDKYIDEGGIPRMRVSLEITRPSPPPKTGAGGEGNGGKYLQDHPFLQCAHESIVRLASKLTVSGAGNWENASAVRDWVHDNLEKDMVDSFSAVQALEAGRGECQAHANLMTAICRAAGIPARVVAGIVWTAQWQGFFYHAWVEIRDGETWYPMDPTLGRETATHVKLVNDGWSEQWRLIGVITRLKVSVKETAY